MKKIMTLIIVGSLLFPSGALLAKERQGAQLEITKTDGTVINGELIGLKQDSTLILESSSKIGASIEISNIKVIKIVKGSNTVMGACLGLLAGGAAGVILGGADYDKSEAQLVPREEVVAVWGLLGGLVVGLFGGAIGSSIHNYETFQIEGKSQEQIKAFLEKLRKEARFPEYQ